MGRVSAKDKNPYGDRKKGTFIVKVDFCQNESWQGRVIWADENKTQHFRSALELVRIMDDALNKQNTNREELGESGVGTA
jgi:hypothetical protein